MGWAGSDFINRNNCIRITTHLSEDPTPPMTPTTTTPADTAPAPAPPTPLKKEKKEDSFPVFLLKLALVVAIFRSFFF